jgi:hypothetical protein
LAASPVLIKLRQPLVTFQKCRLPPVAFRMSVLLVNLPVILPDDVEVRPARVA